MSEPLLNHRYRILRSLGEGGFGKTFLAEDTQMPSRRQCVIKQLKPMSDRPSVFALLQQRFDREAAVLEAVGKSHSQIPDLYAYFSESGQFYLVQEWIEGKPLSALAQSPWDEDRVNTLLIDALGALAHVHQQNIIHRDIKPDNIILRKRDQRPCLIDFGAVKELMSTVVGSPSSPQSSIVIGTPGFMPPEQAAGRPTFASDIYSLAMTAIYLLTGKSPTALPIDSSNGRVLWQQFAPDISTRFASILTRAIHPYFQTRYTTANDMLMALQLAASQIPDPQTLEATSPPLSPPMRSSIVPTVVASPAGQSSEAGTVGVVGSAAGQVASGTAAVTPAKKSFLAFSWLRIGLTAGAIALGTGIFLNLRPQISLQSGASEATLGSFKSQISALEKKAQGAPKEDLAQVQLADMYQEVGDYDQAKAQLAPLLSQNAENAAALTSQGNLQFAQGDYAGTVKTLTQAIDQDKPTAKAYNLRGDAYYETGEYAKAVADYQSALSIDPQNGLAYVNWSAVNVVQGNTQEAIQNLDLAIQQDPTLISAYTNRGSRRAEAGDKVGAAQDWQKAIALPPQTAADYASRGFAKSRMGDKQGAIADYNQALVINPKLTKAHFNRAAVAYEEGNREQALKDLDLALAINPNLVTALILKGEILAFKTDPDWPAALAVYSKAIAVNPNDPDVLNNRCSAYFATKQLDLALADCDRGLKTNPKSAALYLVRGNIRLALENYPAAVQDYSRTLELSAEAGGDPRREQPAYSNRASALVQLQDIDGALADVNKALALKADAPEDYFKRGLIYVMKDDKESGAADMRKAADLYIQQGRTDSHKTVVDMMEQLGLQ